MHGTRYHRRIRRISSLSPLGTFATLIIGLKCLTVIWLGILAIAGLSWIAANQVHFIAGMVCGISGAFVVQHVTRKRKYQPMAVMGTQTELPPEASMGQIIQLDHENRKSADVLQPAFWGKQKIGWMDASGVFHSDRKPPLLVP